MARDNISHLNDRVSDGESSCGEGGEAAGEGLGAAAGMSAL